MNTLKNNIINIFFLILFMITLVGLFAFQFRSEFLEDFQDHNIAKIEVSDFVMYQITKDITDVVISGEHATQYQDKDVFVNVKLSITLPNRDTEVVVGPRVEHVKNLYHFPSGVHYQRSDGLRFYSQDGTLNTDKQVFIGKGDFSLQSKEGDVNGENIIYHNLTQHIQASRIHGRYIWNDTHILDNKH